MNKPLRDYASSNYVAYGGVFWLLPLFAVSVVDATASMLLLMFIAPPLGFAYFLVLKLINRFFFKKETLNIISILIAIASTVAVSVYLYQQTTPQNMFRDLVENEIPASVSIVDKGGQLTAMGISSFYMVFSINQQDLASIVEEKSYIKYHPNNIKGRKPELYNRAINESKKWLKDISEIHVLDDQKSGYRCTVIVVNGMRNKVYFRIF